MCQALLWELGEELPRDPVAPGPLWYGQAASLKVSLEWSPLWGEKGGCKWGCKGGGVSFREAEPGPGEGNVTRWAMDLLSPETGKWDEATVETDDGLVCVCP